MHGLQVPFEQDVERSGLTLAGGGSSASGKDDGMTTLTSGLYAGVHGADSVAGADAAHERAHSESELTSRLITQSLSFHRFHLFIFCWFLFVFPARSV